MADTKISAMTAGTTLVGTEVAPFVQSGANVKITANQIATWVQSAIATAGITFAKNTGLWWPLAKSGVASSVTGTTSETILATITIPAGAMGANGQLRIRALFSYTNSANNKTLTFRLGGIGGTAFYSVTLTTQQSTFVLRTVANRNSQSSQVTEAAAQSGSGSANAAVTTMAKDTSANQDLVLTGILANTGETITLESYTVELLYGA